MVIPVKMTDSCSMDQIKMKLEETTANLQQKKDLLERHKTQYNDFKFKLYDLDQYDESDNPEIPVYINSKGRVKGNMTNSKKILVFLGCEYFVEREPKTAIKQVENKLKVLNKAIQEFDSKIKEAKKAIEDIGHLESLKSRQKFGELLNDEPNEMNEESLPFMDIREELDDDDNIISSTVNPQDKEKLEDFGKKYAGIEIPNEEDELKDLLRDMEITPKQTKKIKKVFDTKVETSNKEDVGAKVKSTRTSINKMETTVITKVKALEEKKSELNEKESHVKFKVDRTLINKPKKDFTPSINNTSKSIQKETSKTQEPTQLNENNEYYKLMNEIGIIDSVSTKFQLSQQSEKTSNQISNEDLNQLQQISNDLDFESDHDDDHELDLEVEEYEYEIETDGEEETFEDEEDEDWDFAKFKDHIIPSSHKDLFIRELECIRKQNNKALESDPIEKIEKVEESETKQKKKKSVSFAPKLDIKEVENISEDLKQSDIKVSKFKQARSGFNNSFSSTILSDVFDKDAVNSIDDVTEKELVTSHNVMKEESMTYDVIEKEPAMLNIAKKKTETLDIVENDLVHESSQTTKKVSKFKSRFRKDSLLISPSQISNDSRIESATPEPLIKSTNLSKPTVIIPPSNTISYEPADEYVSIKAYIDNDGEDEDDLLKYMANEIDVYVQGEGEEDGEEEVDESKFDDKYGLVLLDEIVENDEIDDPDYFVDHGLLEKEYRELRSRIIPKYLQEEKKDRIIVKEEECQELEPIDEHGNPIKVSRFKKSMGRI